MVHFLAERTPVEFVCVPDFPDFHSEQPGGKPGGGRTLECPVFPFGELGHWGPKVTVSPFWPNGHLQVGETTLCQAVPTPMQIGAMERRIEHDERRMGQALIGRLLRACLDRGIEPQLGVRATELVIEDGALAGVVLDRDGVRETVPRAT